MDSIVTALLRGMNMYSGKRTLTKLFYLLSETVFTLKGKNCGPGLYYNLPTLRQNWWNNL